MGLHPPALVPPELPILDFTPLRRAGARHPKVERFVHGCEAVWLEDIGGVTLGVGVRSGAWYRTSHLN